MGCGASKADPCCQPVPRGGHDLHTPSPLKECRELVAEILPHAGPLCHQPTTDYVNDKSQHRCWDEYEDTRWNELLGTEPTNDAPEMCSSTGDQHPSAGEEPCSGGPGGIDFDMLSDILTWGGQALTRSALEHLIESAPDHDHPPPTAPLPPPLDPSALNGLLASVCEAEGPEGASCLKRAFDAARSVASGGSGGGGDDDDPPAPLENYWDEPYNLLVSAAQVWPPFSDLVQSLAAGAGGCAGAASFKPLHRFIADGPPAARVQACAATSGGGGGAAAAAEGAGEDSQPSAGEAGGWASQLDVVAGDLVLPSLQGMAACLDALCANADVDLLRIRGHMFPMQTEQGASRLCTCTQARLVYFVRTVFPPCLRPLSTFLTTNTI